MVEVVVILADNDLVGCGIFIFLSPEELFVDYEVELFVLAEVDPIEDRCHFGGQSQVVASRKILLQLPLIDSCVPKGEGLHPTGMVFANLLESRFWGCSQGRQLIWF